MGTSYIMAFGFFILLLTLTTSTSTRVTSRWCAQCFELNCPESKKNDALLSATTSEWTLSQLRVYFDVIDDQSGPRPCADILSDETSWNTMMATDSACPKPINHFPTCTAGLFQIKSYRREGDDDAMLICQAKIFGCAKHLLLQELEEDVIISTNETFRKETYHTMKMQRVVTCTEIDYCVRDIVYDEEEEEARGAKSYLIIAIIAGVIVVILCLLIFGVCVEMCRCNRCIKAKVGKPSISITS